MPEALRGGGTPGANLAAPPPPISQRAREPSLARKLLVLALVGSGIVGLTFLARALADSTGTVYGVVGSLALGATAMLLFSSIAEWFVHRYLMHRRHRPFHVAYDLHHRAHHWVHFPPDAYLKAEVSYVPLIPPRPERVAVTRTERVVAALGQAAFYTCFAVPALAGGWVVTGNLPFVIALGAITCAVVFLAVHVHDSVHCPGHSPLERFAWFWFLDHHHYIHHVDTQANTNFLLPLGDLLLGTLRRELSASDLRRWPSYEQARTFCPSD